MTSPAKLNLVIALETWAITLGATALHRALSFAPLAAGRLLSPGDAVQAWLNGSMSDAWVCALWSLALYLLGTALILVGAKRALRGVQLTYLAMTAVLLAAHQAYVDFFHVQIAPYHVHYLWDWDFVSANSMALARWRPLTVFAGAVGLTASALALAPLKRWSTARLGLAAVAVLLLCLGAHGANIYTRFAWFVPAPLQMSPAEHLWARISSETPPPKVSPAEVAVLATTSWEGASVPSPGGVLRVPALFRALSRPVFGDPAPPSQVAVVARRLFAERLRARRKPILMVLLMESLRPTETGYFAPQAGASLTPNLDALAAHGVVFRQAFSTGDVTRGAQEAVLCGYPGSNETSLMRGGGIARLECVPDLIVRRGAPARGETFWYHGGEGRYDSQVPYWRSHGVHDFMTRADFPENAPHTGWGVGDKTFLPAAAERLAALRQTTAADYLYGLDLTMSNHSPWTLPSDAGDEVRAPRAKGHESYATTAYADAAIGSFIKALQDLHLWQDTLLIVSSDHGNDVVPLVPLHAGGSPAVTSLLNDSHINLILSGGIMDEALAALGATEQRVDDVVSQADIAAFSAYVLDLPEARFMGQNLLRPGRVLPVLTSVDGDIIDHATGQVFTRNEVAKADADILPERAQRTLLYYRALLQFMYAPPGTARGE